MYIVYFEGKYLPENEAKIPITDRGFLFGDGAYATIQVKEGHPLFLEEHLSRLSEQCAFFGLSMQPVSPSIIYELIRQNEATKGVWCLKVIATGGDGREAHLPHRKGRILIYVRPFEVLSPLPPLKMCFFPYPISACHSSFKSLAHLNRYFVMEKAKEKGVDDCVTLNEKRVVLETAFGNLFWVVGKTVYTPSRKLPLYFGVTIENILKVAVRLGYEVQQVKMPLESLPSKAFCFRTNTMRGICPISQIEDLHFPYSEELEKLFSDGYEELICESVAK